MTYVESRRVTLTEEIEEVSLDRSCVERSWTASFEDVPLFPRTEGSVTMSRSAATADEAVSALKAAVEGQGWEWREE